MPAIALLPAIIGAAGGIGGALINKSGRSGGGSTPLLPAGLDQNALLGDINAQRDLSKTFQSQGASLLGQGQHTLNQPLSYYQSILGGDRTKIMEAMAPGIAAINAQFKAPLTEAGISGRGSALAPDLEASKQSAISNQIFQAQPQAADKLSSIAQALMNTGLSSEQTGASVLGQAAGETLDYNAIIRGIQAKASSDNAGLFGSLGTSLGPILKAILTPNTGGGGTNPSAPAINLGNLGGTGGETDPSLNPALLSSLIHLGSGGAPSFNSSWLDNLGNG